MLFATKSLLCLLSLLFLHQIHVQAGWSGEVDHGSRRRRRQRRRLAETATTPVARSNKEQAKRRLQLQQQQNTRRLVGLGETCDFQDFPCDPGLNCNPNTYKCVVADPCADGVFCDFGDICMNDQCVSAPPTPPPTSPPMAIDPADTSFTCTCVKFDDPPGPPVTVPWVDDPFYVGTFPTFEECECFACGRPRDNLCCGAQCVNLTEMPLGPTYCEYWQELDFPLPEPDLDECPEADGPAFVDDPHLKNFAGEWFDYQGECDLQLIHAPKFDGSQDLDIQARTTIRYDYSYIETAAVRIGSDILEVSSFGEYALNQVEGALNPKVKHANSSIPTVGGYPVFHTQVDEKKHLYDIVISPNKNITLRTFKDWVGVILFHGTESTFGNASGLLGSFHGSMLGRNGTDLHEDMNAFGQDWQIQMEEESFFRTTRAPQAPEKCRLPEPSASMTARRLGESVARADAESACSNLKGNAFKFCVSDVMSSGDLEMAQSGAVV